MKYLAECRSALFSSFFFSFSLPIIHENGKVCEEFPTLYSSFHLLYFSYARATLFFSHAAWEESGILSNKTDDGAEAD